MLSNESRHLLSGQLRAFGEEVRRLGIDLHAEARRLFDQLKLGGAIKAFTPLERSQVDILAAAGWHDPAYAQRYGLDGGSTRALPLENGTTLCAMQAVCSAEPDRRFQGLPLEAYRTVALISHSERLDLGLSQVEHSKEGFIQLWRVHLSRTYLREGIERVVKGLARAACEGGHLQWMLQQLQPTDGLFVLDGNLYPIGLYYALSGQQSDRQSWDPRQNWTDWQPAREILTQPLRVVEALQKRKLVGIGLNKNPGTSWLLDFCLEESERNWSSDAQFIKAVLSSRSRRSLGYTNWFVQERYSLPRSGDRELESFDLFERLAGLGLVLEPRAYHLCFFYLYDPRIKSVLKIEAPRCVLATHDPERLRQAIIAEIARGKGVPNALRRADSRARITTEEAVGLWRACGIEPDYTFNQSRGAPL